MANKILNDLSIEEVAKFQNIQQQNEKMGKNKVKPKRSEVYATPKFGENFDLTGEDVPNIKVADRMRQEFTGIPLQKMHPVANEQV